MRGEYREDRQWSDARLSHVKRLLGAYLVGVGDYEQDARRMGDLTILQREGEMVGVRLRESRYNDNFPYQVTFRKWRQGNIKTEFHKIQEGFGNYFFYGYTPEHNSTVVDPWYLLDLQSFRYHWQNHRKYLRYEEKKNKDGKSGFIAFTLTTFPKSPPVIVHASLPVPYQVFSSDFSTAVDNKTKQRDALQLKILF